MTSDVFISTSYVSIITSEVFIDTSRVFIIISELITFFIQHVYLRTIIRFLCQNKNKTLYLQTDKASKKETLQ